MAKKMLRVGGIRRCFWLNVSVFCNISVFLSPSVCLFFLSLPFAASGVHLPPCLSWPAAPDPTSAGLSPPHVIRHSTENLTTTRQLDEAPCRGRRGEGRGGLCECHRQHHHHIPHLRPQNHSSLHALRQSGPEERDMGAADHLKSIQIRFFTVIK